MGTPLLRQRADGGIDSVVTFSRRMGDENENLPAAQSCFQVTLLPTNCVVRGDCIHAYESMIYMRASFGQNKYIV